MRRSRDAPLPFAQPDIGDAEVEAVVEVLRSGWLTTGSRTDQFEADFAQAVGAPAALALSSGTAALHLGLLSVGVQPGDVVLTTPLTFCSTVHVVEHLGARPVLVDVDDVSLNIDPNRLEDALDALDTAPRAILPVHLAGQPADLDAILEIAQSRGTAVVEDAAHAQGAWRGNSPIGQVEESEQRVVAFSFYATKNITTGEGGMLTGPRNLVERAREWSLHGMSRDAWKRYGAGGSWRYDVTVPGFKYNMMDLQAAIGIEQLRRSEELLARRRVIAERYDEAFAAHDVLRTPFREPGDIHAWHLYMLRVRPGGSLARQALIDGLATRGIGTSVHFIPIHQLTYYAERYGFVPGDFPIANRAFESLVSLPIYPKMSDSDVERVIAAVDETLKES